MGVSSVVGFVRRVGRSRARGLAGGRVVSVADDRVSVAVILRPVTLPIRSRRSLATKTVTLDRSPTRPSYNPAPMEEAQSVDLVNNESEAMSDRVFA